MTATALRPSWHSNPATQSVVEATAGVLAGVERQGEITAVTQPAFAGRNSAWVMELSSGERIFVKQILKERAGEHAFDRSRSFATFSRTNARHAPASPDLIASVWEHGLLIYEFCSGTNLAQLLVEERIPPRFSAEVGTALGKLHSGPTAGLHPTTHPSPPIVMLRDGIPQDRYVNFTLAEISFWSDLQQDCELIDAAIQLREWEAQNQVAPIHGDLRLDQFHLRDNQVQVLDWDEFGLGDPARDLGTFAGEWIYRAVLDTVTTRGGASAPPLRFDTDSATQRIVERIAHLAPHILQMWRAYAISGRTSQELAVRATAHLGWHLVDRTLARASFVPRLPGVERAAAGIGRKILLSPDRYMAALGFNEEGS